jgi:hypothetical protein
LHFVNYLKGNSPGNFETEIEVFMEEIVAHNMYHFIWSYKSDFKTFYSLILLVLIIIKDRKQEKKKFLQDKKYFK